MITEARYTDGFSVSFNVTFDDGRVVSIPSHPSHTHYDKDVEEFLDGGGVIAPYDPYYGWTLEYAYSVKKNEADAYAQNLIDEAFANPQIGITTDPDAHKRRTGSRRKDKADKQAGEIALTQEEKDEAKIDQKLSEYEIKCWDAADKVHGNVDKEDTVAGVMVIDVETNTTWPIWEPPV